MGRIIPLLIFVFTLILIHPSNAALIDWDRKMGLKKIEGVLVSIDRRENQITIKNSANGKNEIYRVTARLLDGVTEDDEVLLKYKKDTNIVHFIKKRK